MIEQAGRPQQERYELLHVGRCHGKPQHLSVPRCRLDQQGSTVGRGAALPLQHEWKKRGASLTVFHRSFPGRGLHCCLSLYTIEYIDPIQVLRAKNTDVRSPSFHAAGACGAGQRAADLLRDVLQAHAQAGTR
jgi:hypothetical protein